MKKTITLKLTPRQAHTVWSALDGQLDAGACVDGNTPEETEDLIDATDQLYRQGKKWTPDAIRALISTPARREGE